MTDIERLSLHGRLRMASVVRGPDTDLMIEAADAIEAHEAFRQEVSDAVVEYFDPPPWNCSRAERTFSRFIIANPDPLAEAIKQTHDFDGYDFDKLADDLRAAIEARGGKIVWGEGHDQ